ncbi:MAG: Gfo/Idh/MocA family oxidoreductase [Thermomicrobiales bacterium]
MAQVYRVGIIGCSPMAIGSSARARSGNRPAPAHSHVDGYRDDPRTEIVSVCDLDPAALDRYREFWGDGVATYSSSDEMLAREDLDLVSIVTPDNRHHQIFAAAADSGVQGILCEKPIATSLEDAQFIIDATHRTRVKTLINHSRRFDTRWRAPLADVASGAIGSIHHVIGMLGSPRAMLFRNGTHLVNTLLWFIQSEPIWVQAAFADADQHYGSGYHGDGGRNPDLEPAAVAIIGFADGSRAVFNANKQIPYTFEVNVYGSTGSLTMKSDAADWTLQAEGIGRVHRTTPAAIDSKPAISNVIDDLIEMVETDGDPIPGLVSARTSLAILLAITDSASSNGLRVFL